MKLINAVLCFTLAFSLCFLCGCGCFGVLRYECEGDRVASAQIVKFDDYVEGSYAYEYTVLKEIEDVPRFIERVNSLKQRPYFGAPMMFEKGDVLIRIEYTNGDFDLIHRNVQSIVRSGEDSMGDFTFDKDQFDELIADYLQ